MNAKELYNRFRAWQIKPFDYRLLTNEIHHCANCHQDFTGNYCPYCSQKAGIGRMTWTSVGKGILGMDTRSLGYSILQLFLRPGYMIGDYLKGERQVSFPPVKMLMIIAMAYLFVVHLIGISVETTAPNEQYALMKKFGIWMKNNPGWGIIARNAVLILPTWLLFRYSPCHTRHTLPDGFFIQVFMSSLSLMIMIITLYTSDGSMGHLCVVYGIIVISYIIVNHQLFGYGWWGTIWRTILCLLEGLLLLLYIALAIEALFGKAQLENPSETWKYLTLFFIANIAVVTVCYFIGRYTNKKTKQHTQSGVCR